MCLPPALAALLLVLVPSLLRAQSPAAREPVDRAWAGRPSVALRAPTLGCRIDAALEEARALAAVSAAQARFVAAPANGCTTLPAGVPVTVRRTVRGRAAVDVSMAAARRAGADRYAGAWWVPLDAVL
jgi:hypothetical protein